MRNNDYKRNNDEKTEINKIALLNFEKFIQAGFVDIYSYKFASKIFIEKLIQKIKAIKGDLTDKSIAELLYGKSNELAANSFAMLKSNKFRNPDSLIDEIF